MQPVNFILWASWWEIGMEPIFLFLFNLFSCNEKSFIQKISEGNSTMLFIFSTGKNEGCCASRLKTAATAGV